MFSLIANETEIPYPIIRKKVPKVLLSLDMFFLLPITCIMSSPGLKTGLFGSHIRQLPCIITAFEFGTKVAFLIYVGWGGVTGFSARVGE